MRNITFIKKLITPVSKEIEDNGEDFQAIVVSNERKMYMYVCGGLNHIITDLPNIDKTVINDLYDKVSNLTSKYFYIHADYETLLNNYDSLIKGSQ